MKNTMIKGIKGVMAAAFLVATLGGSQGTVAAAPAPAADKAPMTDNLSKYGLVKEFELPVTVTEGGLSYTLEKVMIYDSAAPTVQPLIKKYGYPNFGVGEIHEFYKYFIWTKLTIENTGKTTIQRRSVSPEEKWFLSFTEGADPKATRSLMPRLVANEINNTEALFEYVLKPGKKLTTYQAFTYSGSDFDFLKVKLDVNGSTVEKKIAFK